MMMFLNASVALLFSYLSLSVSALSQASDDPNDKDTTKSRFLRNSDRRLLCIFDCEEGEGLFDNFEWPCFGILFDCDEPDDGTTRAPSSAPPIVNYTLCNNRTDGIFGGRPLFGECGVLTEFVDAIFNETDSDGDGQADAITIGNPFEADNANDEDLFLSLFPEGSLLWEIFNEEDDQSFIESILASFRDITDLFSNGFIDDWAETVKFSNETCSNVTAVEPICLTLNGGEGFWVCRTLYDPFSGVPSDLSVCIDKGEFLAKNDVCGCCGKVCPASCPCKCDLDGINDGVMVTNSLFGTDITFGNRCVKPEFATAAISRYGENIECLETCPVPAV